MLKEVIEKCPPEMWNDPQDQNKFWHVTYHTLFYTHLYLSTRQEDFKPWEGHRENYQYFVLPWPPYDFPKIEEPYTSEELLTYLEVCWYFADNQISTLDLEAGSGFSWQSGNKLELVIYNLRHIQQHIGELMERLGNRAKIDVDWK